MIPILLALVAMTRGADGLVAAVDEALAEIWADRPLALDEEVAVAVLAPPALALRASLVSELLSGRLERHGVRTSSLSSTSNDATEELSRLARLGGAEWLLVARLEEEIPALGIDLMRVDRGFWVPAPARAIAGHAFRRFTPAGVDGDGDASSRPEPPRASLSRVAELDGRVLAMAACNLGGGGAPSTLAILDDATVRLARLEARSYAEIARLGLASLERAPMPVRDPIGGIVCADLDGDGKLDIAFGHSSFGGHKMAIYGDRLEAVTALPGIPLALAPGGLVLAQTDRGRNRWARALSVGDRTVDLGGPVLDLGARLDGKEWHAFVVTPTYELVRLDDGLSPLGAIGTSGTGISVAPDGSVVTTSTSAPPGRDAIAIVGHSKARPRPVPGPIRATCVASVRERGGFELLVAVARSGSGTDLYVVEEER